jgi:endonuclease/exonuclease/phosphatase (EEP) superfamily protein YafD
VSIVPLLWPLVPQATILAPMAPQCAVLGLLLAIPAVISGRRRLAALSLAVAAWNAQVIWADVSPFRAARSAAAGETVLKLVNFNLRFSNQRLDVVAEYLIASDADVIGLVEVTPISKAVLDGLKSVYPYSVDCIGQQGCQSMLFSKLPLKSAYAGPVDGRYPTIAMAEVELAGAAPITVGVVHVLTPFARKRGPLGPVDPGQPAPRLSDAPDLEQSHQAANLGRFLQKQPRDFVLIGDFNSAPWSPMQQAFRAASGLDNRGHFLPSWPTWIWSPFRIPIDPVFTGGRATVSAMRLGPDAGSDHLPIEAEIAVAP